MGYLNDAAPSASSGVSLVFLPARAAAVAVALSTIANSVAFFLVVRVGCGFELLDGQGIALLCFDAFLLLSGIVTGIVIIYGRFRPPVATRIWTCVREITLHLLLSLLTVGLSVAVIVNVLVPRLNCNADDDYCIAVRQLAVKAICSLAISLVCLLALAILVTLDLRRTRPHAQALIYHAEMREAMVWRAETRQYQLQQAEAERALIARAQLPLDADEAFPPRSRTPAAARAFGGIPPPVHSESDPAPARFAPWGVQTEEPVTPPAPSPLGGLALDSRAPPSVWAMHSVSHRHHPHHPHQYEGSLSSCQC
ncbi:hypothetical protein JCM8202_004054 [Rhodotorula sphaerocarpa]